MSEGRAFAPAWPASAFPQVVRERLVEWVRETYRHITSATELSTELQQLRHCLATVARACSLQLAEAAPQVGGPAGRWLGQWSAPRISCCVALHRVNLQCACAILTV